MGLFRLWLPIQNYPRYQENLPLYFQPYLIRYFFLKICSQFYTGIVKFTTLYKSLHIIYQFFLFLSGEFIHIYMNYCRKLDEFMI